MSKYENVYLAIMKISIFLIIIGFTHFVVCNGQNITDDSYAVCPVKFRRKRALTDYTRWRANIQPTSEFIVKILDEDQPPKNTKKVVAVNIQPVTKGVEKIIVGGAMVTMQKPTASSIETLKDYTRFVPPTTVALRVEGDLVLAPVQPLHRPILGEKNSNMILPHRARNPQRDESPPAGPQFLPRAQMAAARQYAPITPVGFFRRTDNAQFAPLTPPSVTEPYIRKLIPDIFRTTPFGDVFLATRTNSDREEFGNLHAFDEDTDQNNIPGVTNVPRAGLERTINEFQNTPTVTADSDFWPTTKRNDDYFEKKNDDKSFDSPYGLFENYEDKTDGKQTNKDVFDAYDDKVKDQVRQHTKDIADVKNKHDIMDSSVKKSDILTHKKTVIHDSDKPGNITIALRAQANMTDEANKETSDKSNLINTSTVDATHPEISPQKNMKDTLRNKRRQVCSLVKLRELSFKLPSTLPEIEAKLKHWAETSPVAKWVDITDGNLTTMERPVYMMMVDDPSSGQVVSAKKTVMIVAGIQGRDQHAVTAAMYVLYQLIERTESHTDLLKNYRFWIIPVFNPDGYNYAMTFPHRREWTKNLCQNWDTCKGRGVWQSCESFGLRCTVQPCYGVNLDRNFEYQWISKEELQSEYPCGMLYAGKRQLSEVETAAFVKYLHSQHRQIHTFIAFKEGDVLGVMYPYSHTKKKRANEHIYKQRAYHAAAAAQSISGRRYLAGQTSQFLPLYAGGIEDWVDGHLGVDNTYTIMMYRPRDTYNSKPMTERVVHEAYAAMDTLVLQSVYQPTSEIAPVMLAESKYSNGVSSASISVTPWTFVTVVYICLI